ncbi:MAG: hypothetical protein ACK5MA_10705 [Parachlamydiaceae bacterium]
MTNSVGSGIPNDDVSSVIFGPDWVQLNGPDSQKLTFDQLTPSEQAYIITILLNAQTPLLVPPDSFQANENNMAISNIRAMYSLDTTKNNAISSMLDNWLTSIQQQAQASREADQRQNIERREIQREIVQLQVMKDNYFQQIENESAAAVSAFALGMIITGAGITQMMLPDPSSIVSFTPIQEIAASTIQPIVPDLSMLIPVFCLGIMYTTAAQVISQPSSMGEEIDQAYAQQYAENMLALVGSNSFGAFLNNMITASIAKGTPVSEQRMSQLASVVRLVLLSTALALVYVAEAGKMTSIEFRAMLNGEIELPNGDIRNDLLSRIEEELGNMDPNEREALLASLDEFFDSNPTMETLSSPTKVFKSLNTYLPQADFRG